MTVNLPNTPKKFMSQHGFSLLRYAKGHEVYRRTKEEGLWMVDQFVVRRGDHWFATREGVGDGAAWTSPPMGGAEAAFIFAEVERWSKEQ